MLWRTALILAAAMCVGTSALAGESATRTGDGLLVLYTFEQAVDDLVEDQSGVGEPLNLHVEQSRGLVWRGSALTVTSSSRLTSVEPARKIVEAVRLSGSLTIEAWITPNDALQNGPARIVTLSADPLQRDFTLGQEGSQFDVRLRTSATNENGIPSTSTAVDSVRAELMHVVFTRNADGAARFFLNGEQTIETQVVGDLSNWTSDFQLSLANEWTDDRPWLGELHLVAIYGRALSPDEVAGNYSAGVRPAVDYAALLPPASGEAVEFVRDVQPILRDRCYECHAAENEEGGLNLGVRDRALEGGDNGRVIEKGGSARSRLIHLVAGLEPDLLMPPSGERLTPGQIGMLRAWIDQGAVWPDGTEVVDRRIEQAHEHWAYQPLHGASLPEVTYSDWPRNPIDRFILSRLETEGLSPAPRASSRELIRRVYFDLIGLPPTPEEVADFDADCRDDPQSALETLVDRLLGSRGYGERWGRHWLDIAHYADSDGYESDHDRPTAYHYRDFVIGALNDDMPFDQFVRWQLAGDEYEPENPAALAATGFLVAGPCEILPDKLLEEERLKQRYDQLDDTLSTIGTGLLGLTIGCARCHDHKYDAITARDYYRLLSAFHSGDRMEIPLGSGEETALGFRDFEAERRESWYFRRADFYDRRTSVQLGFIAALTNGKTPEEYWEAARAEGPRQDSTNQRRAVAEWVTDTQHGAGMLLARVIVNRLWQHHFGEAMVPTVGDFGVRAEPPSHPELLEWLAHDLVENGWQLKRLHRLMLTSAAFQQTSLVAETPPADPGNRLLWKMRPQRLEAEVLRDSLLMVSGTLNSQPFGPGFKPPIAAEAMLARNEQEPYPENVEDSTEVRRRTVYMFHKRVVPYPLLQAFDKPDAQQCCNRRDNTTVAPQALALLNDPFVRRVSQDFADRLRREVGDDPRAGIERAWMLALARLPSESESEAAYAFLETQVRERIERDSNASPEDVHRQALADFCQSVFSLNEFLYVD